MFYIHKVAGPIFQIEDHELEEIINSLVYEREEYFAGVPEKQDELQKLIHKLEKLWKS